jgi:hypothetical protein
VKKCSNLVKQCEKVRQLSHFQLGNSLKKWANVCLFFPEKQEKVSNFVTGNSMKKCGSFVCFDMKLYEKVQQFTHS